MMKEETLRLPTPQENSHVKQTLHELANTQTRHHRSISRNHVQDLDGLPSVTTREQYRLGRLTTTQ